MHLKFSNTPLGRFRMIALVEGVSFILLLMAMPFKYLYGLPQGVKVIGWMHGLLFILYLIALLLVMISNKWSFKKATIAFIASLIPFGTFVLDAKVLLPEEVEKV